MAMILVAVIAILDFAADYWERVWMILNAAIFVKMFLKNIFNILSCRRLSLVISKLKKVIGPTNGIHGKE